MKTKGSILVFFIIAFLVLRSYVPYISYRFPLVASIVLHLLAFVYFFWKLGGGIIKKYALLFCVPLFDIFFSLLNSNDSAFLTMCYGFIQTFVWALVCEYIIKKGEDRYIKVLYVFVLIVFSFTAFTTYLGCQIIPGASRNLATGLVDNPELRLIYANLNIGGFGFIYVLVLLLPILLYIIRFSSISFIKKAIVTGIIVLFFITINISEYSTAIIIAFLTLLILLLPPKLTLQKAFLLFVGFVIVGYLLNSFLPVFFHEISGMVDSYEVSTRMEEMGDVMNGRQTSGDFQARVDVWDKSWQNFISSPLFGTGEKGGGHSYVLDHMSKYGLFGLFLILLQFHSLYKITVRPYLNTNYSTLLFFVFALNLVLCIVNTQFIYTVFLVFIPLFINRDGQLSSSSI